MVVLVVLVAVVVLWSCSRAGLGRLGRRGCRVSRRGRIRPGRRIRRGALLLSGDLRRHNVKYPPKAITALNPDC